MKKVLLIMFFCMGTVAYAQYVPSDLMTSDPATNQAIGRAIQQYGEKAVREALQKGNASQSTNTYQNQHNGYQNNPYQNNGYQNNANSNSERVISAVYFYEGRPVAVNLKYSNGHIWAYCDPTSRNVIGQPNWNPVRAESPMPTDYRDGNAAGVYNSKVLINNTWVYFNL